MKKSFSVFVLVALSFALSTHVFADNKTHPPGTLANVKYLNSADQNLLLNCAAVENQIFSIVRNDVIAEVYLLSESSKTSNYVVFSDVILKGNFKKETRSLIVANNDYRNYSRYWYSSNINSCSLSYNDKKASGIISAYNFDRYWCSNNIPVVLNYNNTTKLYKNSYCSINKDVSSIYLNCIRQCSWSC